MTNLVLVLLAVVLVLLAVTLVVLVVATVRDEAAERPLREERRRLYDEVEARHGW